MKAVGYIYCFCLMFSVNAYAKDSLRYTPYGSEIYPNINYDISYNLFSDYLSEYDLKARSYHYFVIYSQLDEQLTNSIISNKIASVTARMYSSIFDKTPDEVISVFIFRDSNQYESFAYNILNLDVRNYKNKGFFTSEFNTVIVNYNPYAENITHEIIHSFTGFDFPSIPVWFDEGIASQFEKSYLGKGQEKGSQDRSKLNSIRKVLLNGEYKGIIDLIKNGNEIYYERGDLFNYALAQYFVMFLQEKGLLEKYYKYFRDNFYDDPSGLNQLSYILGKNKYDIDVEFSQFLIEKIKYISSGVSIDRK